MVLPFGLLVALMFAAIGFIAYVLWPTWPSEPVALDTPAVPITVAGVLFDVPPASIRVAVQRHSGPHERIDLAFQWPSLTPPQPDLKKSDKQASDEDVTNSSAAAPVETNGRLFVTIAALGTTLPPAERLHNIYPRYVVAQSIPGRDGLAILPFRDGTPYAGEDLVYFGAEPDKFFARCTRPVRAVPGTCIHERLFDGAEMTLRFPREWLRDWRGVAAGFDRLVLQLKPENR